MKKREVNLRVTFTEGSIDRITREVIRVYEKVVSEGRLEEIIQKK